jgi:predicted chitinase
VTSDQLRLIMPRAGSKVDIYKDHLAEAMAANGIHSAEQQAAFLAQVAVESRGLQESTENLNYSARRLIEVFPKEFPTLEVAKRYEHYPEAMANRAYAGKNGNVRNGDGYRYRGRGLMQVTGRDNYRAVGFEDNPEALEQPKGAAAAAAAYWRINRLNERSSRVLTRPQFEVITRIINGKARLGSDERWTAYQRALGALKPRKAAK